MGKHHKPEEITASPRQVEALMGQGVGDGRGGAGNWGDGDETY